MSTYTVSDPRKVTTKRIADMRLAGEKIAMITAYDYTMATLVDQAGIDIILVGDSASNVMQGNATTIFITIDDMIVHGRTVVRAVKVSQAITVPTIGIGAGGACSRQVLVLHDILGPNREFKPKFLRVYNNLREQIIDSVGNYISDVKSGDFPNADEQY